MDDLLADSRCSGRNKNSANCKKSVAYIKKEAANMVKRYQTAVSKQGELYENLEMFCEKALRAMGVTGYINSTTLD
jgi:hypothetical protein